MTDPALFLSTIILASAGLVAIIGGLLVARFVSLDSDQRGSRKVMSEARERLNSAQQRAKDARDSRVDWHAGLFFQGPVLRAIGEGTSDPAELMRLNDDWPLTRQELQPYADDISEEFARARATLSERGSAIDQFYELFGAWFEFRRATSDLPEIRRDEVWENVFYEIMLNRIEDEIKLKCIEEQQAAEQRERQQRRREREQHAKSSPFDFNFPGFEGFAKQLATDPDYSQIARLVASPSRTTDSGETRARREDELRTADERAQQQVEDYEAELKRLQQAHAEIVRPDARLWWGVGILGIFAIVGVGLPAWVMSQGPDNLASVWWLFWPFAISLALLIGYIVVYLVKLTSDRS